MKNVVVQGNGRLPFRIGWCAAPLKGSMLIFVIWILILMTVLAASVGIRSRLSSKISSHFQNRVAENFLMHSAVNVASFLVYADDDPDVDSDQDAWYGTPASFETFKISRSVTVTISDEESKINLNKATEAVLENFFKVLKENDVRLKTDPNDLVASIIVWQGKSLKTPRGRTTLGHVHKKAPFESVDELRLIQYITPEDYKVLEPFFTVFGRANEIQMRVNLNTVHDWILKAVIESLSGGSGSKELFFDRIQLARRGKPGQKEGPVRIIFAAADLRPQILIEKLGLSNSPEMVAMVSQLVPFLTVDSQFFSVHVETKKEGGVSPRKTTAILGRRGVLLSKTSQGNYVSLPRLNNVLNNYPYEVLSWSEAVSM